MKLNDNTFGRLYSSIKTQLQKWYDLSESIFDLSSPFGMLLRTTANLFQLNKLNIINAKRMLDLNDNFNNNTKNIRSLARLGQYMPNRGVAASGNLNIILKPNIDPVKKTGGNSIIFINESTLLNKKNNLKYSLKLNKPSTAFSLETNTPIYLDIVQGVYKTISFTGTGEINQSYVVPKPGELDIDQYDVRVFVNSEEWTIKKHKFDLLENENACVVYTSFSGGIDIIFGNISEGAIPPIGSEIVVKYLCHDGKEGNISNYTINDFTFITQPINELDEDIDITEIADIDIHTNINFGSDGDTIDDLKNIIPYATANFVLSGVEQYIYFLKRLKMFSTIDVFTNKKTDADIKIAIFELAKKNIELLNSINNVDNANSLKVLVEQNLHEIRLLRKLYLTDGGENIVKMLLIPDIHKFFGQDKKTNYFNIDIDSFILSEKDKERVITYLYQDGIQTITNEIQIVDPIIKRFAINITVRLFEKTNEHNIINEIITYTSNYFLDDLRRDRIPISDIVRIVDNIDGIDSATAEFISEDNELYHKEYLLKHKQYFLNNGVEPKPEDIMMSDGMPYNPQKTKKLDLLLGDIILEKNEYPLIRGGFTDRYNNKYAIQPGTSEYSPINILILPERSKRKHK